MYNVENKNDKYCKAIVDDLIAIVNGEMAICRTNDNNNYYCDEMVKWSEIEDDKSVNTEDFETATLYDYFETDIYNIDYIIDSYKEYKAVRVMIACGGPNVYINTWDKAVQLYWWSESGEWYIPSNVCEEIDNYWSDYYEFC